MTFTQYYTLLCNFDWFYSFSDDSQVYQAGSHLEGTLSEIATRHDFTCYMYSVFSNRRADMINQVAGSNMLPILRDLKVAFDAKVSATAALINGEKV